MTTTIALATSRTSTDEHDPNNVAWEIALVVLDASCTHYMHADGYTFSGCGLSEDEKAHLECSGRVSGDEYVWRIKPEREPTPEAAERYGWHRTVCGPCAGSGMKDVGRPCGWCGGEFRDPLYRDHFVAGDGTAHDWTWNSVMGPRSGGHEGQITVVPQEGTPQTATRYLLGTLSDFADGQPLRVVGDRAWHDVAALRRLADLHDVEWPDGLVLDTPAEDDVRAVVFHRLALRSHPERLGELGEWDHTALRQISDVVDLSPAVNVSPPDDLASAKNRADWYTAIDEACR